MAVSTIVSRPHAFGGRERAVATLVGIGLPLVEGASVTAEVIGPEKGEKLVIQKPSRHKTGERHVFTRVKIAKITA